MLLNIKYLSYQNNSPVWLMLPGGHKNKHDFRKIHKNWLQENVSMFNIHLWPVNFEISPVLLLDCVSGTGLLWGSGKGHALLPEVL